MIDAALQIGGPILLGLGGAFALLKFFGKTIVEHELEKSLKKYDAQLTEKTESLKTQLSIYAHEQNVALSRVDAQRASAIQNIYAATREWVNVAAKVAVGSPHVDADAEVELDFYMTNAEAAHSAAKLLSNTLADNAIYFDIDIYSELAEFVNVSADSTARFLSPLRQGAAEGAPPDTLLQHVETKRREFGDIFENDVLPKLGELTDKFRQSLGVIRTG